MNFEWKVITADLLAEAEQMLNKLDQAKFEIVSTHAVTVEGRPFLSIIARKVRPTQDIRY